MQTSWGWGHRMGQDAYWISFKVAEETPGQSRSELRGKLSLSPFDVVPWTDIICAHVVDGFIVSPQN